ncbi:MAG: GNAT family N-acetyltransferase [Pseudomonadales bacterium]|nr:GNAT family N-acetyltransferase [Pseudomonadales bacterium]
MNPVPYQSVEIIAADDQHLLDIQRLAHEVWFDHYPGIITREQISYMLAKDYDIESLRRDLSKGIAIDRMIVDDELRGFAAYGPWDAQDFKLHKLYLAKSFHGLGLGSMLLRHVEEQCSGKGATRLVLSVNKNNHKAIRAYQRNGYAKLESVVVDIGQGFVMDDFVMGKELS